jgi:hypothetical protein
MSLPDALASTLVASFLALPFVALVAWVVCCFLDRSGLLTIRDIGRAVIIVTVAYIAVNALFMVGAQTATPRASEDPRVMQQVNEAPDVPQR